MAIGHWRCWHWLLNITLSLAYAGHYVRPILILVMAVYIGHGYTLALLVIGIGWSSRHATQYAIGGHLLVITAPHGIVHWH